MDRRVYDNYVMQIAEHGSLTKAAVALGISQPALSSGLTALEKELGFAVFNRRKNPVTFTAEGEVYYEFVQRTRVLESDMQKRIDAMHSNLDKSLVIGAPVAYMDSMVSDAVVKLLEEHPDYRIALKSGPLAELMELASKGEVNCFVSTSGELPERFETQLVKQEKLFLCVPRDAVGSSVEHPINNEGRNTGKFGNVTDAIANWSKDAETIKEPDSQNLNLERNISSDRKNTNQPVNENCSIAIPELNNLKMILLEAGQPLQKEIDNFLKSNDIKPQSSITVNQVSTAVNLALRGVGACVASEDALNNVSESERNEKLRIYRLKGSRMELALQDAEFKSGTGAENTNEEFESGTGAENTNEEFESEADPGNMSAYNAFKEGNPRGRRIYIAYDKDLKMPMAGEDFIKLIVGE